MKYIKKNKFNLNKSKIKIIDKFLHIIKICFKSISKISAVYISV